MRISDWSSDVCSSDLRDQVVIHFARMRGHVAPAQARMGGAETVVEVAQQPAERPGAAVMALAMPGIDVLAEQRDLARAGGDQPAGLGDHGLGRARIFGAARSEEHTSELQSLMPISYAVFCLKKT